MVSLRYKMPFAHVEPVKQKRKDSKMLVSKIPAPNSVSSMTSLNSETVTPIMRKTLFLYPHLTPYQIQNAGIINSKDKVIVFLQTCVSRLRLRQRIRVMRDSGYIEKLFPGDIAKALEASPNDAWLIEAGRPSLANVAGWRLRAWRDYLGERLLDERRARCFAAMEAHERNKIECCEEREVKERREEKEEEKKEEVVDGKAGEVRRQG